ncbi:unnamed protein product [marine sediment metagenome]|uniref:Uncharacterized protein n=1 Tax=marine sediment metagenome TaxID=412755 RepID=X0YF48_9ZZZZ
MAEKPANGKPINKSHLPKRETARIYGAFIYYWGLGHKRTLKKVGEQFGVGTKTAKDWSRTFGWVNRISDMDRVVSEKLAAEAVDEAAKIKKAHLAIVGNLTGRLMQFLKDNKDASLIESMQDFERLVKTQLLLMDQPTEIVDQKLTVISAVPSTKK